MSVTDRNMCGEEVWRWALKGQSCISRTLSLPKWGCSDTCKLAVEPEFGSCMCRGPPETVDLGIRCVHE